MTSLTRSSERTAGRSVYTGRPAGIFTILITGVIAVAAVVTAVTSDENRVVTVCVGAFMGAVCLMMVLSQRRSRAAWSASTLDGAPAWRMSLGDAGQVPAAALVLSTTGVVLVVLAALADHTGVRVVLAALALFMLVLSAEFWRIWVRRPDLTVSADRLRYRGPGIDVDLDWNDVGVIDFGNLGSGRGALRATAARGAPSYRFELRRLVLPTDRVPEPAGIEIRTGLVPEVVALSKLLRTLHAADRSGREAMITRGLPDASGL